MFNILLIIFINTLFIQLYFLFQLHFFLLIYDFYLSINFLFNWFLYPFLGYIDFINFNLMGIKDSLHKQNPNQMKNDIFYIIKIE